MALQKLKDLKPSTLYDVAKKLIEQEQLREDPPGVYAFTLGDLWSQEDGEPAALSFRHSTIGQHKIEWDAPLLAPNGDTLPGPGSVVLYSYPHCSFSGKTPRTVSGGKLRVLERVVEALAMATTPVEQRVLRRRDASGAYAIHALLISNFPSALSLVLRLYARSPKLQLQAHGKGPFRGEHGLHILAVNRREEHLLKAVRLAYRQLSVSEYLQLMSWQTAGPFFTGSPMVFYGSTIMGFAASHGLVRACGLIIHYDETLARLHPKRPVPNRLRDESCACSRTGLAPLHCAVAHGQVSSESPSQSPVSDT